MVERSHIELKVRSYLEGLSEKALTMLVRGLEAARENGAEDPQSDLILRTAGALIRSPETDAKPSAFRRNMLKRAFFEPLDPFLISEILSHKVSGRIYRPSLDAVWQWLERDIAPKQIAELQTKLAKADYEKPAADAAVTVLRDLVLKAMSETLEEAKASGLMRQKVAYRVGGDNILAELADIHAILVNAKDLKAIIEVLPDTLDAVDLKTDELLLTQAKSFVGKDTQRASWLAALFLTRAEDPAWLVSFAARAARSSKAALIHRSPYNPFVEILVSELERHVFVAHQARANPVRGELMVESIRRFADLVRDVNIEITLDDVADWRKPLEKCKADMGVFLEKTLATVSADLRRTMQIPTVDDDGRFRQDSTAIADAQRVLRILLIARHGGEDLAVSELATRLYHGVEQILDTGTRNLMETVRSATGDHRRACLAAVDTAVLFCGVFFGDGYARTLRNRRDKLSEAVDLATFDADGLFSDGAKSASGRLH